jgi:hypothetical protein
MQCRPGTLECELTMTMRMMMRNDWIAADRFHNGKYQSRLNC